MKTIPLCVLEQEGRVVNPGGEEPEDEGGDEALRRRVAEAEAEAEAYRRLIAAATGVLALPVRIKRRFIAGEDDPPAEVV